MSEVQPLLDRASRADAEGRPEEALSLAARAVEAAREPAARFEALLHRARAEYATGAIEAALETYWEARRVTKDHRLGRLGEADLGIGMTMLDLGRDGEGLETVRRAARLFRKTGQAFLRGCAETVIADEALRAGDLATAARHLEVASDLLQTAPDPRTLSSAITLSAEVAARRQDFDGARKLLANAEAVALRVSSPAIAASLRDRRRRVRDLIEGDDDE